MKTTIKSLLLGALAAMTLFTVSCASGPGGDQALTSNTDARKIESQSRAALSYLYKTKPKARALAQKSKGVLVFPSIVKGGLVVGGSWGDGALYEKGKTTGYYRSISASWGLQAGIQKYGYVLFLMDADAIRNLNQSGGWAVGSSPNLVVVDQGVAASLNTATIDDGTYAVIFNQMGLMGGIGLEGTKVTRLGIKP